MKKLSLALVFGSALFVCSTGRADVRFQEVNPVMQALVDAVSAADEYAHQAVVYFDVKHSDFRHEKLKYDLKGDIKSPPWTPGARAYVSSSCSLVGERAKPRFGIRVTSTQGISTDTLALLRYGAGIALQHLQPNVKFAGQVNGLLKQLQTVKTMGEFHSLLVAGQALALNIIDDEMINHQDAKYSAMREAYAKTQIKTLRQGGEIFGIQVTNATNAAGLVAGTRLAVIPDSATLWIVSRRIDGELKGFASLREDRLNDLRDSLKAKLEELQAGSSSAKADTFRVFSDALYEFKRVIQGWI